MKPPVALVREIQPLLFQGQEVGELYKYSDQSIKAVVEKKDVQTTLRVRLTLMGFIEDDETSNTYWLMPKKEERNV